MTLVQAASSTCSLLSSLLSPFGISDFGVTCAKPRSWNDNKLRLVPLGNGATLKLAHDDRGGPYALTASETEDKQLLVSLSDETQLAVCVWARIPEGSQIVGLGVDLSDTDNFAGKRGERFNPLIFPEFEQRAAKQLCPDNVPMGYAHLFSAKEAAFKACAAPLRRWYESHDEKLLFEVRHFERADDTHEVGTGRDGAAQRAMGLMGIGKIVLVRGELEDTSLSIGVALSD